MIMKCKIGLSTGLSINSIVYIFVLGRPKEVEVTKSDDALGLTITDNGAGYAFIKRIREDSVISKLDCIQVLSNIEKRDQSTLQMWNKEDLL